MKKLLIKYWWNWHLSTHCVTAASCEGQLWANMMERFCTSIWGFWAYRLCLKKLVKDKRSSLFVRWIKNNTVTFYPGSVAASADVTGWADVRGREGGVEDLLQAAHLRPAVPQDYPRFQRILKLRLCVFVNIWTTLISKLFFFESEINVGVNSQNFLRTSYDTRERGDRVRDRISFTNHLKNCNCP